MGYLRSDLHLQDYPRHINFRRLRCCPNLAVAPPFRQLTDGSSAGWKPALRSKLGQ